MCGAGWTLLCVCVAVAEPIIGVSLDALRCAPHSLSLPPCTVPAVWDTVQQCIIRGEGRSAQARSGRMCCCAGAAGAAGPRCAAAAARADRGSPWGRGRARGVGVRTLLLALLVPWVASMYLVWQVRAVARCAEAAALCVVARRGWRRRGVMLRDGASAAGAAGGGACSCRSASAAGRRGAGGCNKWSGCGRGWVQRVAQRVGLQALPLLGQPPLTGEAPVTRG
jgi:hypothetical protein